MDQRRYVLAGAVVLILGIAAMIGTVADVVWLEIGAGLAAGVGGVTLGLSIRRTAGQATTQRR